MTRKLTTGFYQPTASFQSIPEHFAVMDADNQTLVSLVGAVDDDVENVKESIEHARLFAAAPELLEALTAILALAEDGVVMRNETGKPQWSLIGALKDITRAAIAKANGE